MPNRSLLALSVALWMVALPAQAELQRDLSKLDLTRAEQDIVKGGPALKAHFNGGNASILVGGRGVAYQTESIFIGGEGYGGSAIKGGQMTGGLGYGGFVAGAEAMLGRDMSYEVSLLLGGVGGDIGSGGEGSFVVEPGVALSRRFGGGTRGTVSLGYLYAPTASALSGVTLGLRLDFKTLEIMLPLDD